MSIIDQSLEQLIRQHAPLSTNPSSKGWWACTCQICHDYKKRAGFKFENDTVAYHCFNCNHNAVYDPTNSYYLSDNMIAVLDSFNVAETDYKALTFNNLIKNKNKPKQTKKPIDPDTELYEIACPKFFIHLNPNSSELNHKQAIEYLKSRGIDPKIYQFMVIDRQYQCSSSEEQTVYDKWKNRLIIPYYRSKKLIWYQGRDCSPQTKMRYLNADSPSECILGNHDVLFNYSSSPLYITEGFFDSILVNGVCVFGNTFKIGQIKLLQSCNREKIYIPDNSKDGQMAAYQAIKLGWKVSIPDIGSCKDLNAAYQRYGKLYVMKSLYDNILTGNYAKLKIATLGLSKTLTSNKLK